jgi:hypothetical protein
LVGEEGVVLFSGAPELGSQPSRVRVPPIKIVTPSGDKEPMFSGAAGDREPRIINTYTFVLKAASGLPLASAAARDEIYHAAQGIRTIEDAHGPLYNLYAFYLG